MTVNFVGLRAKDYFPVVPSTGRARVGDSVERLYAVRRPVEWVAAKTRDVVRHVVEGRERDSGEITTRETKF